MSKLTEFQQEAAIKMQQLVINFLSSQPDFVYQLTEAEEPDQGRCIRTADITTFIRQTIAIEAKRSEALIAGLLKLGILTPPVYQGHFYQPPVKRQLFKINKNVLVKVIEKGAFPLICPFRVRDVNSDSSPYSCRRKKDARSFVRSTSQLSHLSLLAQPRARVAQSKIESLASSKHMLIISRALSSCSGAAARRRVHVVG